MAAGTGTLTATPLQTSEANTNYSAKSSGRYYRPELDALRFFAFILVFCHHAFPTDFRFIAHPLPPAVANIYWNVVEASRFGLSLFFTLSAYLICELLLRERIATGTVQLKQFYLRRILRIWPLYFLGLAIAAVFALSSPLQRDAQTVPWVLWSSIMLGNLFFGGGPSAIMGPLWSINVEEQFYLVAPWMIKFLRTRWLLLFSAATLLVSNLWLLFLGRENITYDPIWFNSFVNFENFAGGIVLCVALRHIGGKLKLKGWQRVSMACVAASLWYAAVAVFHISFEGVRSIGSFHAMLGYGCVTTGCCLLLLSVLGIDSRWLPGRLIYLGRISYGLYVFHAMALYYSSRFLGPHLPHGSFAVPVRISAALILTVLLAAISYRWFETPFLRMKKRHELIESRPI